MDWIKAAIGVLSIMLIAGGGYFYGNKAATEKYLPQLTELKTRIIVADEQAKATTLKQKENENAVATETSNTIARINAKYERLLQAARDKAGASAAPLGTPTVNGTSEEQSNAERAIEFERSCVLDAASLTAWQDWATKNQIPIGD